jgi:glucokinase
VDGDLASITVAHVLDAARQGDGVAISVIRDTAKYVGMAAANLVVVIDPAILVLGGIMASAADLLLELVRTEIARRLSPAMMQALTIVPAALGGDGAAIGAAKLAAQTLR